MLYWLRYFVPCTRKVSIIKGFILCFWYFLKSFGVIMRANEIFSDKNFEIVFSPVKLFFIWKIVLIILNETFFCFVLFCFLDRKL